MSWKAYEYYSRKTIGTYRDEMTMARDLRGQYAPGDRFIVENDDGAEFEAFMDEATVKIVSVPKLAVTEDEDVFEDATYSPSDR